MAVTRIGDLIVPEIFTPYMMALTTQRSAIISSGAVVASDELSSLLAGGGLTFNVPFYKDLADVDENISSDNASDATPNNITAAQQIGVRLNRNNMWGAASLASILTGDDPMSAIAELVSGYWQRRLQAAFVATMKGIFADNDAAPSGADTHTRYDLTFDSSGSDYTKGVTDFTAEGFINATTTMGDHMGDLTLICVHSVVYSRMLKNNLIDFIPDAVNPNAMTVPAFLGRRIVVDDGVPYSGGVFQSWLFGSGACQFGSNPPANATETDRNPKANNGAGEDYLHSRVQWCLHPVGHAYIGTSPNGGPSNAATSNNLAHADSWRRVFPERKQIKMARLLTREF